MVTPQLSIVIVTWNVVGYLDACLKTLLSRGRELSYEIIAVDNASTDATLSILADHGFQARCAPRNSGSFAAPGRLFDKARHAPAAGSTADPERILITNSSNIGFSAANNMGLQLARAPLTLFLNPDTEVQPEALLHMVRHLDEHPSVVAVGPKLTSAQGVNQGGAAGFEPTLRTLFNYAFLLYTVFPRRFPGIWLSRSQYLAREPIPVDWVSGAALMVRTDAARTVGGWPEEFFLYAEDICFCRKLRELGDVQCLPCACIIHHIGRSAQQEGSKGLARNVLALDQDYRARFRPLTVSAMHLVSAAGFAIRWLFALLKGRGAPSGHSAPARALWKACTLTSLRCALGRGDDK